MLTSLRRIRQLRQQSEIFFARGPSYLTSYALWRATRLAHRWHQRLRPPTWPSIPGLSTAGVSTGAPPEEAGPALAEYLAARELPYFHFSVPEGVAIAQQQIPEVQQAKTLSQAEALLDGRHSYRDITVVFDGEPDWHSAPNDSIDWRWDLNRHYWLPVLARAWRYRGDDAFAQQATWLMRHWVDHNPPDVRNPVWRPFEVATRLNNWVWGLFLLLDSAPFIQEGLGYLWQGLIAQSRYLYRNLEHHVMNNHLLVEAKTLAMLGLLFPEVQGASGWLRAGLEVLWKQVRRQFHPDGVHTEQATQYHCLCTGELWEILSLLRRNDHPIPRDVLALFEAAIGFQTAIVKPDGHIPLFGDSARHDLHQRFDARWALVWLGKGAPPAESPSEETWWLLGMTPIPDEPGPLPVSCTFPYGGYAVTRDAARYLAMDCGPFGDETVPSHGHADALSLEVYALGETLLTDSGGYSYHAAPVWRDFFRGTCAHNTVVVDGQDQSELVGTRLVRNPARAKLVQWLTTPIFDWAVAEHDGYTRFSPPVIHRRRLLYVKPHYWLLFDSLLGDGKHRSNWFFHLPPGVSWTLEPNDGVLHAAVGQAGLTIITDQSIGLDIQVVEGQVSPPQGWVSLESGRKTPAPTLMFTNEGSLPVHLSTAIVPYPVAQAEPISLRALMTNTHQTTIALTTPYACDYIGMALEDNVTPLQIPPFEAKAQVLLVRHVRGQPPSALAMGVREISVSGHHVWAGPTARWISLGEQDDEWRVVDRE